MRGQPTTVVSALADTLRSDPGRPLVTMYDDATGERVELSVATFENWVCKLANLLRADWDLGAGDLVRVDMPPHWQSMVALVAAWTAGLTVTVDATGAAAATVAGPAWDGDAALAGQVLACSLRPLGQGFTTALPAGWLDWAAEVPPQPDALLMPHPLDPADAALVEPSTGTATHATLVARGLEAAETSRLVPGGRLLTDLNPADPEGMPVALLAPLVTGSSVVLLVNAAEGRRDAVAAQERVTTAHWCSR